MRTDLPETCLSTMPGTGELIVLKRGETGYYHSEWNTDDAERNRQIADDHNRARGLTPAQVEAMRVGSMFGFAVPGANPQRYLDLAKQEEKFHVEGHIKDTVISLYHPITCNLLNYKVAGKVVTYLEPIALPDSMMGAQSGITLFAEMVGGEPLIPVLATRSPEQKYTFGLADGCFSNFREVNQGYLILAKVRVGAKEFVLAESPTAPSRFATWARTLANDGDGPPNYYHGNYCSDRNAAILDFCNRARNQYEYEISVRRVAPHRENDRERKAAMRKKEMEMAGDYEVIHSLRLGGKVMLIGYNPNDQDGKYMTCYKESNFMGEFFTKAMASDDYMEIVKLFSERLQEQMEKVKQFRTERGVPLETLGAEHCRKRGEGENLAGKLIILRPSSLSPEYRTADCQLGYATGGFGCTPNAGGRAVYFRELYSGEECRWNIGDVLGIADTEKLPEWAKRKVAEHEKARAAKEKERGEAR